MTHIPPTRRLVLSAGLVAASVLLCATSARAQGVERRGTDIFYGGEKIFLRGYGDYQPLTDPAIDIPALLDGLADRGIDFYRVWAHGYSNVGGAPGRDVLPFRFSGGKYDLTRWDATFFDRLRQFCERAKARGMIVELSLFDHWAMYNAQNFAPNPWNAANNVNGVVVGETPFPGFYDTGDAALMQLQRGYVEKVVTETKDYGNIFYEIMNEAGGADDAAIAAWHQTVGGWIKTAAPGALTSATADEPAYAKGKVDIIALHYDDWRAQGDACDHGPGNIAPVVDYFRKTYGKPVIVDDDGAWHKDCAGVIVREDNKRLKSWVDAVTAADAHFNHKDLIPSLDIEAVDIIGGGPKPDAGQPDTGDLDAGISDAGPEDDVGPTYDAGVSDGGSADSGIGYCGVNRYEMQFATCDNEGVVCRPDNDCICGRALPCTCIGGRWSCDSSSVCEYFTAEQWRGQPCDLEHYSCATTDECPDGHATFCDCEGGIWDCPTKLCMCPETGCLAESADAGSTDGSSADSTVSPDASATGPEVSETGESGCSCAIVRIGGGQPFPVGPRQPRRSP
ncbi:MAG: hypothetical protein HY897_15540 [Deltaproteobacteria bacterium]|nr:hypothetical protein [Deltaproteobacteria bacterium]